MTRRKARRLRVRTCKQRRCVPAHRRKANNSTFARLFKALSQ